MKHLLLPIAFLLMGGTQLCAQANADTLSHARPSTKPSLRWLLPWSFITDINNDTATSHERRNIKPPLPWHFTWSFASSVNGDKAHDLSSNALPDEHVVALAPRGIHFDLLYRYTKHWEFGLGYFQFSKRVSGFTLRSVESSPGWGWFFLGGDYVAHGDGFGLERSAWSVGPMVAYAPFIAPRRHRWHCTIKFIGALRFMHFTEAQVIAPDYSYSYSTYVLGVSGDDVPPFPKDRPITDQKQVNTVLAELGIRSELQMGRYVSLTLDLGAYLSPSVGVSGCSSTNAEGDQLVIPTHDVNFSSGVANLGLAAHF